MPGLLLNFGANVKQATAGIKEVSLSLKDQQAVLKNLQREYAALSTAQARGSAGKLIAADIKIANAEIGRLKAGATSAFGAIGTGATKAFSAARNLAYVLPGLGIAGIFGIAISGIEKIFDSFGVAANKVSGIITASKDKFVDAATAIGELKDNIGLAKAGFISKEGVVKQYNETLGKTFGFVKNLDEAEQGLVRNGNAYIQITLQKAVAHIAASKAAETYFKILEEQRRPSFSPFDKLIPESFSTLKLKQLNKELQEFQDIASGANAIAAIISKAFGANFFGELKPPKELIIKPGKLRIIPDVTEFNFIQSYANTGKLPEVKVKILLDANIGEVSGQTGIGEALTEKITKEAQELTDNINSIIQQLEIDTLTAVGEAIGTALAGGDLGNVFQKFADQLGSALSALGKEFIKFGVIGLAAKTALKAFGTNPYLAIAAGIALVAAGAALKTALNKGVSGRATGGPVGGGVTYLVGERGPELFQPSSSGNIISNNSMGMQGAAAQMVMVVVKGKISGRDIALSQARDSRYNNSNV